MAKKRSPQSAWRQAINQQRKAARKITKDDESRRRTAKARKLGPSGNQSTPPSKVKKNAVNPLRANDTSLTHSRRGLVAVRRTSSGGLVAIQRSEHLPKNTSVPSHRKYGDVTNSKRNKPSNVKSEKNPKR